MIFIILLQAVLGLAGLYLLLLAAAALFVKMSKVYEKDSPLYRFLENSVVCLTLWFLRMKVEVQGLEKLPEGPFLLVINHEGALDPLIFMKLLPRRRLAFISKQENMTLPVIGRVIHRCGILGIDRKNPRQSLEMFLTAGRLMKAGAFSYGIFPEGTRNRGDGLLPFHNGIFKAARQGEVPVLVAAVRGTHATQKNWPWRRTPVQARFLTLIPKEEVAALRNEELGARARAAMEQALKEIDEIRGTEK